MTADSTWENYYIVSPFGLAAVIVKESGAATTYYAETDHLGSLIGLMNSNGTHAERFSFDAWGRRRNPADWSYSNVPEPVLTERGFTGHEHMDLFGLINMNGRIYDPVTARFLNSDPVIQNPFSSQSFNAYSYVANNPLINIDPSGYKKCKNPSNTTERTIWTKIYGQIGLFFQQVGNLFEDMFSNENSGSGVYMPDFTYRTPSMPVIPDYGTISDTGPISSGSISGGYSNIYRPVTQDQSKPNGVQITKPLRQGGRWMNLGQDRPRLYVFERPDPAPGWNGRYEIHILVFGLMYSEYNWLQTYSWNGEPYKVESCCIENGGLFYNYKIQWAEKSQYQTPWGADGFFYDRPGAKVSFSAQLTLLGKRNFNWEVIQTFTWGYTHKDGITSPNQLAITQQLSILQQEWILRILRNNNK